MFMMMILIVLICFFLIMVAIIMSAERSAFSVGIGRRAIRLQQLDGLCIGRQVPQGSLQPGSHALTYPEYQVGFL